MDKNIIPIAQQGGLVQVQRHTFDTTRALSEVQRRLATEDGLILLRKAGVYRVLFVFNSGNIFAIHTGDGSGYPQVIEPKHIISKVEERRAA